MTYQDTVNWMYQQLPMYQNQGKTAYRVDLDNIRLLVAHLNQPQDHFKSIHVGGTNGKGSTSHMLASILQEAGYTVGLYTSPHLKDFRERIKINEKAISEAFVVEFIQAHKTFFEAHTLSFFEMTVGMAFYYFSIKQVDIAIIEVGMGGRLDATNVIVPEVSVITNIGLDHTRFLGNTLEAVAYEKGGIIKPKIPVVIGETQTETAPVFKTLAQERHSRIWFADQAEALQDYESDLKGDYQKKNKQTVCAVIQVLQAKGFKISEKAIVSGFNSVVRNTGLYGRWQVLQKQPLIICDTAHNREGLQYTMAQVQKQSYTKLHIVYGIVNDKDVTSILPLLPKQAHYYFCKPDIPRGLDATILRDIFVAHGFKGNSYDSVKKALQAARQQAIKTDMIYVGGSTFVVAEII